MSVIFKRRPKKKRDVSPPDDFSVAFQFKYKKGLVPIEIVKFLEWSPLQGKRLMEKRVSLPTRRNQERNKGFLSQEEVVEILEEEYNISFSRQGLTYLEQGYNVSSVKPQMILALCEIVGLSLEELYID